MIKEIFVASRGQFFHSPRMVYSIRRLMFTGMLATALMAVSSGWAAQTALKDGLYAEMETSKGTILLQLEFEKTPLTVANFVGLAEGTMHYSRDGIGKPTKQSKPFYDGLVFHRVIPNFMVQGGCPLGTGTGSPGYRFRDEFDPSLRHSGPGILSMANSGPGSNGSQFFITHVATPWLNNKHSVFGKVVTGMDVVNSIAKGDKLVSVRIIRQGVKAGAFKGGEQHFQELKKSEVDLNVKRETKALENTIAKLEREHGRTAVRTASGLKYIVIEYGNGEKAGKGRDIKAHYSGRLVNGTEFDSSYKRGVPLAFTVGIGRVIKGWDEALADMAKGEKRVLIISPDLGYGAAGHGGVIPPNATLIFEVEMVDF